MSDDQSLADSGNEVMQQIFAMLAPLTPSVKAITSVVRQKPMAIEIQKGAEHGTGGTRTVAYFEYRPHIRKIVGHIGGRDIEPVKLVERNGKLIYPDNDVLEFVYYILLQLS